MSQVNFDDDDDNDEGLKFTATCCIYTAEKKTQHHTIGEKSWGQNHPGHNICSKNIQGLIKMDL